MRKLKNEELGRLSVKAFKKSDKLPFFLLLDNIRSLNNIGSIFRTADAFKINGIYLCGITATPPHRDIQKTALGATESVYWKYIKSGIDALEQLKSEGYRVYALEQTEQSILLNDFQMPETGKIGLVFGHEVKGVQQEVINNCDGSIEIPQFGTKHSFNVTVAAGIVLWDMYNKSCNL